MTSYRDELDWAYHGEVYGEAMFAAMAEIAGDPARSAELAVLALVEKQTKEQLAALCDREGVVRDDAPHEAQGRELAQRAARPEWQWDRFLRSIQPYLGEALGRYLLMRNTLAPESDAAPMRALVRHEQVIQRYTERALAAEGAPAEPLLEVLEGEHRQQAQALLRAAAEPR